MIRQLATSSVKLQKPGFSYGLVPFLAGLPAKDLCPIDRCDLAHPALLLCGHSSVDSGTGPTYPGTASDLDAFLDVHRHRDLPTDPDPLAHLHPDGHTDTPAGNECHLNVHAASHLHTYTHPHANRNTHRHQYPDHFSHAHRHTDRFAHLDGHVLADAHPHTDSHSYADPYPDPYMDTNTHLDAKPHAHRHIDCIHHADRHSATTLSFWNVSTSSR
jgi:hypothetical protein